MREKLGVLGDPKMMIFGDKGLMLDTDKNDPLNQFLAKPMPEYYEIMIGDPAIPMRVFRDGKIRIQVRSKYFAIIDHVLNNGYPVVNLYQGVFYVGKLVLSVFSSYGHYVYEKKDGYTVGYMDGNKMNLAADNLYWKKSIRNANFKKDPEFNIGLWDAIERVLRGESATRVAIDTRIRPQELSIMGKLFKGMDRQYWKLIIDIANMCEDGVEPTREKLFGAEPTLD